MIRYVIFSLILFCIGGGVWVSGVEAQSRSFNIGANIIATDTTPPTVPAGLVATPVTISQINLSWSAATDNIAVTGYVVWRDGSPLATTTSTTLSDTGLASSTLYTYAVQAFDAVGNYSASSSLVATSTLAPPPPPAPTATSSRSGGRWFGDPVLMSDVDINVGTTTAIITFVTDDYVHSTVTYTAPDGSSQVITGAAATKNHTIVLTDLLPGTTYRVSLDIWRRLGLSVGTRELVFTTGLLVDETPPPNVLDFRGSIDSDSVLLEWVLPADPDIADVRIVRSDRFFPLDTVDGWVIYEGDSVSARDSLPPEGGVYYYTIFVRDRAGNTSSGAITLVSYQGGGSLVNEESTPTVPAVDPFDGLGSPSTIAPESIVVLVDQVSATSSLQYGSTTAITQPEVTTFRVAYDTFPRSLKTIVLTMYHPSDPQRTFSFLLRADPSKQYYEAVIGVLPESGLYPVTLQWYDFATKQMGTWSATLTVEAAVPIRQTSVWAVYWWIIPLIVLLFWLFARLRTRD